MMADIITIIAVLLVPILALGLYQKHINAICKSKRRLDGKTAIITGGTAGMGLQIAMDFAQRGAKVIIASPYIEEGNCARNLIISSSGNKNVSFKLLDLASLKSVREFAEGILKSEDRLDLLMNNAGVGTPGDFLTEDGMNFIMQVNYFGTFLLTLLLLPLLKRTGTLSEPTRIVNTSSPLRHFGVIDIKNLNKTGHWFCAFIYANSKLCDLLFTYELVKRLTNRNVIVNTVNPGIVGTRMILSQGWLFGHVLRFFCLLLFKNPWEGAQTAIHVAVSVRAGQVSGGLFKNCKLCNDKIPYNNEIIRRLWEESMKCVQLREHELVL